MLRVTFYHVGKGDLSLVLLPNGDAIMIDCYKADEMATAITGDDNIFGSVERTIRAFREVVALSASATAPFKLAVAEEKAGKKKIPIATLFVTHADRDHITVRRKLREKFDIAKLVDSGRDYDTGTECMKDYLEYRRQMKNAGKYQAYTRAQLNILPLCGATVDILCPNRDVDVAEDNNNQCMVIRVAYQNWSFLFTGDSPSEDWFDKDHGILKLHGSGRVKSDILNASHHGSRTFFTASGERPEEQPEYEKKDFDRRGIQAIAPLHSFITCSDDEDSKFPHPIALEVYKEETNVALPNTGSSHTILSRDSTHLHYTVTDIGELYSRTSRSRTNQSSTDPKNIPCLIGYVSGGDGYLTDAGVYVCRSSLATRPSIKFRVQAKGKWEGEVAFDWWVLNNGQSNDVRHREYYTIEAADRTKKSEWSRELSFAGIHLMQCHASTDDGAVWANWCVPVCHQSSLQYANKWLELNPGCLDPKLTLKG